MLLERLTVEEGFLNGLDMKFAPGLNVIIGPRGVGKTSVIELIRFVLGGVAYSEPSRAASLEHALGVLAGGRVTLQVKVQGREVTFQRTATTASTALDQPNRPIILSQREVELLGRQPKQRLRLLDGFVTEVVSGAEDEKRLTSSINSVSAEIRAAEAERARVQEQRRTLHDAPSRLDAARKQQLEVSGALSLMQPLTTKSNELASSAARAAATEAALRRAHDRAQMWLSSLRDARRRLPVLDPWPDVAGPTDLLVEARSFLAEAARDLDRSVDRSTAVVGAISRQVEAIRVEAAEIDASSRSLRRQLEEVQAGAGEAARAVSALQQQVAQLEAIDAALATIETRLQHLRTEREALLDQLDGVREHRYVARAAAARLLERHVGSKIRIEVERFALLDDYESEIAARLRGSALHGQRIASEVAKSMSPRELVAAIAASDILKLASVTGMSADRSARVIAYLREREYEDLVGILVEDDVKLSLLDGTQWKPIDDLSTGQRCTVVLPIILVHPRRTVIVDQPEDHLDNAFVVDTLIEAIKDRKSSGQMIATTHNANIPVLGEADRVFELASNGRNGFVRSFGRLDDSRIVEAISSVMEGGREAFARRAAFYQSHVAEQ